MSTATRDGEGPPLPEPVSVPSAQANADFDRLLPAVLDAACAGTYSDAGSMWVVLSERRQRFWCGRNDTLRPTFSKFDISVVETTITGFSVLTREPVAVEDVYDIPRSAPFTFYRGFDREARYRTKSTLSFPVLSARGRVLALIHLVNRKREKNLRLVSEEVTLEGVVPYSRADQDRVAGMAAVLANLLQRSHPDA